MTPDASTQSAKARERGNALYKQRKLAEALSSYNEAASLSPKDPAPVSNISAVQFEMGRYSEACKAVSKALSLHKLGTGSEESRGKIDKLYVRLAKCHIYSLELEKARKAITACEEGESKNALLDAVKSLDSITAHSPDPLPLRKQILDRVPRYKPALQDEAEYYAVGHDVGESQFDQALQDAISPEDDISFLFCGSGDARHFFATLFKCHVEQMMKRDQKLYAGLHLTLMDLKAAALARTLIILYLLCHNKSIVQEPDKLSAEESKKVDDLLETVAFIFAGVILPPKVHEILQEAIAALVARLERKDRAVFPWLAIETSSRSHILRHLKHWQQPLGIDSHYAVRRIIATAKVSIQATRFAQLMSPGEHNTDLLPGCENDERVFQEFTMITPTQGFLERHEPDLKRLVDVFLGDSKQDKVVKDEMNAYLDENWKTNVTLIDLEWQAKKDLLDHSAFGKNVSGLDFEANSVMECLLFEWPKVPKGYEHLEEKKCMVERMSDFFRMISASITINAIRLRGHFNIEMVVGEMADFMEQLRYGCLEYRNEKPLGGGNDPSKFPKQFDRIHMSNIPDYTGGLLAPMLYARPLLKPNGYSTFRFNVLLNPPRFTSHDKFQSEYLLMHDKRQVTNHFDATLVEDPDARIGRPAGMDFYMGQQYWIWQAEHPSKQPLPWPELLGQPQLEKWLYAHLLKICLPYPRPVMDGAPVYAPLNLTAVLRLVVHLHGAGYPAHWLAGVLNSLCSGHVTTRARAPRDQILDVKDVDEVYPSRKISVRPWRAEFTMLLSIWRGLLPFGFLPEKDGMVSLAEIDEYTISFPEFESTQLRKPHFMLVFWDSSALGDELPSGEEHELRKLLLDDEDGDPTGRAKKARDGTHLHVAMTFSFVTETRAASLWLKRDVAEVMLAGTNWNVGIWRTDSWELQTRDRIRVADVMRRGRCWI